MSTHITAANATEVLLAKNVPQWFAIQTRSRHEKKAADELRGRGIEVFLPLITQTRKWSDRAKKVDFPLFAGYAFVHIAPEPKIRLNVLSAQGVVRFVGPTAQGTAIPGTEIENLRLALVNEIALRPLPFVRVGQKVRIRSGALAGMEGILMGTRGQRQLVVSISTIQRSVSLAIEGYDVEPL